MGREGGSEMKGWKACFFLFCRDRQRLGAAGGLRAFPLQKMNGFGRELCLGPMLYPW